MDDKKPTESNNKSHGLLIQNLRGFRLKLTILAYFKDNIHENYIYVKSYLKKEWDSNDLNNFADRKLDSIFKGVILF